MSHKIIDGKKQAQVVKDEVCARVNMLTDLGWRPRLVSVDIGDSAAVIDIGINLIEVTKSDGTKGTKTVGDVDFNSVHEVAGWITPVPGGVGPMTVAMLLRNTVVATERQKKRYEDAMRE